MRANTCTYFKNGGPLASSAQNIDILSRSNRSVRDYIEIDPNLAAMREPPSSCYLVHVVKRLGVEEQRQAVRLAHLGALLDVPAEREESLRCVPSILYRVAESARHFIDFGLKT